MLRKIFPPKKILELKISNPKNSFDHPDHLKSPGVTDETNMLLVQVIQKEKFKQQYKN